MIPETRLISARRSPKVEAGPSAAPMLCCPLGALTRSLIAFVSGVFLLGRVRYGCLTRFGLFGFDRDRRSKHSPFISALLLPRAAWLATYCDCAGKDNVFDDLPVAAGALSLARPRGNNCCGTFRCGLPGLDQETCRDNRSRRPDPRAVPRRRLRQHPSRRQVRWRSGTSSSVRY